MMRDEHQTKEEKLKQKRKQNQLDKISKLGTSDDLNVTLK